MIAYLEKYDTTAEVPDDIGEQGIKDVNDNFHNYVDPNPAAEAPTPASAAPSSPGAPPVSDLQAAQDKLPEKPTPKWQPNFYGAILSRMPVPIPQASAYLGKAAEELTFGAAKPLVEPIIGPSAHDHPAFATAGEVAGGMGSLLEVGGALRIEGLAGPAVAAGKAAVEAGFAAGERFIPRAIMTGATFGTRTFIAETVKAFEEHGVNLEQFGKDVLKDTAFGATFGAIGGLEKPIASISSAGALGFISSKMQGGDNREASLHAAIWGAFETVGSLGKSEALRMEALNNLKESIGEYARGRNPDITPEQARAGASAFVDQAVTKAGFKDAEAIAKSGPENLLEGIEKVNQIVRTAQIPHPGEPGEPLPKLPAPIEAAAPQAPAPETPKSPLDKAIDTVKGIMGIEKPPEDAPTGAPSIEKSMADIADRLTIHGLKDPEKEAIFSKYADKLPEMIRLPIEDQYQMAYSTLAKERGITAGKPDAATMDQAEKAVDLINDHFNPKSQEVLDFAKAHQEASVNDVAQMAHDRGMLESPNPDLLMAESRKAIQEKIVTHPMVAAAPPAPVMEEVAARVKEHTDEIKNLVTPANAAPLAAQITRANLGKMARSYDMAEAALSDASKLFEKQPKEANIDFIDKMERGLPQGDPKLEPLAEQLRDLLDTKRKEIQDLGTGKLKAFNENYFPHIWDQGEKEVGQAVQKGAKRPFEGSKAFLKARSIEFTKQGVEAGLTPVSYNPVDLTLLKMREMDKYIMAHRTINEYKANGLAKYVKVGVDAPEGWTKIDDRISTVFKSPMVAVKEAYDEKMMSDLNKVGQNLGIDLERGVTKSGEGQRYKDAWGLSQSDASQPGKPGKIWTKFAGPESALAHELGHQLDHIYGLQDKFLSNYKINRELQNLAKERATSNASEGFKKYIQQPSEKMAVMMEAYIHAPELFKQVAPTTNAALTEFLKSDPKLKPLMDIEPSLVLGTNKSEVYAGGAVIAGHIFAQPDAARIINNYLSPGLQQYKTYQAYRYAGNLLNQFQLGFSAFHLGFTSLDSAVSKFALGLNELMSGHPINAVSKILQTPFAPITNIIQGDSLLKAWRGEGKNPIDNILATAMASGGGRARMDQFYATKAYEQMKHHFEAGNVVRGLMHIPMAIADISSKPILEYIVPRQKLGVFSDIMQMEMQNNPNMTHDQTREIAQRAWDSVDNRMGQLVYDNLFWNRTFKDLLMGSMRSVGWNLGTLRELGGGVKDYIEAGADVAQGKKPEFSYRMAYVAALPIVVGMLGAIAQYLRTGKGPQTLKDYYFPQTGGTDVAGDPHRVALPSYMKDIYHYTQAPVKTVTNKLNPLLSMIAQMLENKDYYGTKIRNEDDPLVKQVQSEVMFMLKQATPFSIRNMQKNLQTGNHSLFDTVGPWVGITPAPYDIDQTKAEKAAHEIAMSHQSIGGRTEAQAQTSRLLSELTRNYKMGDPKATDHIFEAYQQGLISHRQMQNVITNAELTPLQRMVKGMTLPEAERIYGKATDEEKAQIDRIVERKRETQQKEYVPQ